jgi:hypothetical protein
MEPDDPTRWIAMKRQGGLGFAWTSMAALGIWLLLAQAAVAYAQGPGSGSERDVRVEWALERTNRPLWTLCGSVYNDRHVPARHVQLRVERLDDSGSSPGSRVLHSVNDVPAGSRTIFCLPVPAGSGPYRVIVEGVDWGYHNAP